MITPGDGKLRRPRGNEKIEKCFEEEKFRKGIGFQCALGRFQKEVKCTGLV